MNTASIISGPFHIPLDLIDDADVHVMSPRAAVLEVLAALQDPALGYSYVQLSENTTPGCIDAIRAHARANQLEVVEDCVDVGNRKVRCISVKLANGCIAQAVAS